MPSTSQDKSFSEEMNGSVETTISHSALDNAIEWISGNLSPDDVFSEKQLKEWAENNGYAEKE